MTLPAPLARLVEGAPGVDYVLVERDGAVIGNAPLDCIALLPGSFNPLHHGHEELARVASDLVRREVLLEMSLANVDKPPLTSAEVERRLAQFHGRHRAVLTRAPRFVEKARLFPGSVFVIGWDTTVRLVHPRYYGGSEPAMLAALAEMRDLGVRFLVAGRASDGRFLTLLDTPPPAGFEDMFDAIPESLFRADVSSTELRG